MTSKFIYYFYMVMIRKTMVADLGKDFYKIFYRVSKQYFKEVLLSMPDIGNSVFKFNFAYTPSYISWYKALKELNMDCNGIQKWIWRINEIPLQKIPSFILKKIGAKIYLGSFRKKAAKQEARSKIKQMHPYDYDISYKDIDESSFSINIYQCGMMKLCADFGAVGLFPSVCRIDYMIAHYMGFAFWRSTTLGDGDNICNCNYSFEGICQWQAENGSFENK